jgi:hypothetical protein
VCRRSFTVRCSQGMVLGVLLRWHQCMVDVCRQQLFKWEGQAGCLLPNVKLHAIACVNPTHHMTKEDEQAVCHANLPTCRLASDLLA